jgi:activator of 2-hydroxyglutaryl-CoA dehydratase
MPCRGGGPAQRSSLVDGIALGSRNTQNALINDSSATKYVYPPSTNGSANSSLVSRQELSDVQNELNQVTEILCDLCKNIEENNDNYFSKDPILREWWENHKEMDRIREEQYRTEKGAALENATRARVQQKKYIKYLLDDFLDNEDKEFFNKKIATYQLEIDRAITKFPELAKELELSKL